MSNQPFGQPAHGIPSTHGNQMYTTYSGGMMDANSAQMHANALVFGEPPAVSEAERKSVIPA